MIIPLNCYTSVMNKYLRCKGVWLNNVAQLMAAWNQSRKQDAHPKYKCTFNILLLRFSLLSPVPLTPNGLFNLWSIASFNHWLVWSFPDLNYGNASANTPIVKLCFTNQRILLTSQLRVRINHFIIS